MLNLWGVALLDLWGVALLNLWSVAWGAVGVDNWWLVSRHLWVSLHWDLVRILLLHIADWLVAEVSSRASLLAAFNLLITGGMVNRILGLSKEALDLWSDVLNLSEPLLSGVLTLIEGLLSDALALSDSAVHLFRSGERERLDIADEQQGCDNG